ncbi:MAG: acyl-CoA thioesterase [Fimbriimonadaceae bacterium]|nr:acyl-CoA thioesterase [Fimbriimonadaceae bacterium]QYK57323.1 MAG: acyl-CoA thioesterase [Fimbriimonadaceae bacterium]
MDAAAKSVGESRTKLAQVMTPTEANFLGNVFGGAILSMIDLTASATAQKFSGKVCVTASFDRVDFHEPIEVGELVTMEGVVSFAGRTSMEVTIAISATNLRTGLTRSTNTARVTMVAIEDGRPSPVPRLVCETRDEKIAAILGQFRRQTRTARLKELEDLTQSLMSMNDSELESRLSTT